MGRNLKNIPLAHPCTLPAPIAALGIDVDKVNLEISISLSHRDRPRRHENLLEGSGGTIQEESFDPRAPEE
jgi:hypothetical protein